MKKITLIVILSALLTSCAKQFIQLFDIGTRNTQLKDGNYVFENDTLKVTYFFWASKGVMSFSIYNKLNKPVYIDWENSSMIYNDKTLNYWADAESASISNYYNSIYFYKYHLIEFGFTENPGAPQPSASEVKHEKVTFIPPKAHYDKAQFCLLPVDHYEINLNSQASVVPRNDKPKKETTVYSEDFSYNNSPIKFRNIVSFSCSKNSPQLSFLDHSFYLASVKEMDLRHYLGKSTGYDKNYNFIFSQLFKKETSFYINILTEKNIANRRLNERRLLKASSPSLPAK